MSRKSIVFWITFVIGVILDQATKIWVYTHLAGPGGVNAGAEREIKVIDGFLSIVHAQNPGAAFGLLRDSPYRHFIFLVFTVVACVAIVYMWKALPPEDRWQSATLGLIFSGAVGNGIDRAHKQTVTDFILVYTEHPTMKSWLINSPLGSNEWPSFNVADAALVVGVIMFMIHYVLWEDNDNVEPAVEGPETPEPTPPIDPAQPGAGDKAEPNADAENGAETHAKMLRSRVLQEIRLKISRAGSSPRAS